MDAVLDVAVGFFEWLVNLGAAVVVPLAIIILGLIFRAPLKTTLLCALRMGVGFTALNALIGVVVGLIGEAGEIMGMRYGVGLSIPDVGWPVFSGITFAAPFAMGAIALFILVNALLVIIGFTKTLNVDFFNHWIFVFTILAVYVTTDSWALGIISGVLYWLLALKLADWTAPMIEPYYGMPNISIPHIYSVQYAPFGFFMDKVWDRIPVIKDIELDPESIREKYGLVGEPVIIGFAVGLIFGGVAFLGHSGVGTFGEQVAKTITLALSLGFFMVLLPRAAELIVMGLAPLSESIREFVVKRMPGREFYVGLDVAVLVGRTEHIALGALLAPIVYMVALVLPGNKVLPLADAAAYMIFFSVFAVNTNRGNLFRGLLNATLIWLPLALVLSNVIVPASMAVVDYVGFEVAAAEVTSITAGSNFFTFIFLAIASFIKGVGSTSSLFWALLLLIVWLVVLYVVRKRPREYAEELRQQE